MCSTCAQVFIHHFPWKASRSRVGGGRFWVGGGSSPQGLRGDSASALCHILRPFSPLVTIRCGMGGCRNEHHRSLAETEGLINTTVRSVPMLCCPVLEPFHFCCVVRLHTNHTRFVLWLVIAVLVELAYASSIYTSETVAVFPLLIKIKGASRKFRHSSVVICKCFH